MVGDDIQDGVEIRQELERLKQRVTEIETADEGTTEARAENPRDIEKAEISRRIFLKLLGLGTGGLALSSTGLSANLLDGTTINDEIAWHTGNDGPGSGLNADMADGNHVEIGSSKPESPPPETLFFDLDGEGIHFYDGESWIPILYPSLIYGHGLDGSITRRNDGAESGILYTNNFTIESGVTRTASGTIIILAKDEITINGTLDATGGGASGGTPGEPGSDGTDGLYASSGGDGGDGGQGASDQSGGSGGVATGTVPIDTDTVSGDMPINWRSNWQDFLELPSNPAAGGGGGAHGDGNVAGNGGNGGNGGGLIILIAPTITIGENATISAEGQDGDPGENSSQSTSGGGGGGGGGAGGLICLLSSTLTENGTVSVVGGSGGSGGNNGGSDGTDGEDGEIHRISVT